MVALIALKVNIVVEQMMLLSARSVYPVITPMTLVKLRVYHAYLVNLMTLLVP